MNCVPSRGSPNSTRSRLLSTPSNAARTASSPWPSNSIDMDPEHESGGRIRWAARQQGDSPRLDLGEPLCRPRHLLKWAGPGGDPDSCDAPWVHGCCRKRKGSTTGEPKRCEILSADLACQAQCIAAHTRKPERSWRGPAVARTVERQEPHASGGCDVVPERHVQTRSRRPVEVQHRKPIRVAGFADPKLPITDDNVLLSCHGGG